MKINGQSIRGLFTYTQSVPYEKGDLVIEGTTIYRCKKDSAGNAPSKSPDHFEFYLAGQMANFEDFTKYLMDNTLPDKYVSMYTLNEILQSLCFGLSDTGVITSYVNDISGDYSVPGISEFDKSKEPLDAIMEEPTLNNGVLRVSRELSSGILPDYDLRHSYNYFIDSSSTDVQDVILRQYTYDNSSGRFRVQELIDPIFGTTCFRRSIGNKIGEDWEYTRTSKWSTNLVGEDTVKRQLDSVKGYLNTVQSTYKSKFDTLSGRFRFARVEPSASMNLGENSLVNVILSKTAAGMELSERTSVTFDTSEVGSGDLNIGIFSGDFHLTISKNSDGTFIIAPSNASVSIVGIYKQENYGN